MSRRGLAIVLTAVCSLASPQAQTPKTASLEPLRFLLGTWTAEPDPTGATGGFTFEMKAQDHVVVRTNYSNTPATATTPASRHDDVMMVYVDGTAIKADYVDSEGHVIRYVAQAGGDRVSFVSEIKSSEPRYRLSYVKTGEKTVKGSFEIAPPGRPDDFAPYLSWTARKN